MKLPPTILLSVLLGLFTGVEEYSKQFLEANQPPVV